MFFLTAIFQNKFGKADKYYDEKGWHWMLASDKPKLYSTFEEAKKEANELAKDILSEITIKEIQIYEKIWEHKVNYEAEFEPSDILFSFDDREHYRFLSQTKQTEQAKLVKGLYRVDRIENIWIYGVEQFSLTTSEHPDELIFQSYQKLQEAKALMQIFDFDKSQITKVDGVLLFVNRLLKGKHVTTADDSTISTTPEELILLSYEKLDTAKNIMYASSYDKSEIVKVEGVMNFVKRLM